MISDSYEPLESIRRYVDITKANPGRYIKLIGLLKIQAVPDIPGHIIPNSPWFDVLFIRMAIQAALYRAMQRLEYFSLHRGSISDWACPANPAYGGSESFHVCAIEKIISYFVGQTVGHTNHFGGCLITQRVRIQAHTCSSSAEVPLVIVGSRYGRPLLSELGLRKPFLGQSLQDIIDDSREASAHVLCANQVITTGGESHRSEILIFMLILRPYNMADGAFCHDRKIGPWHAITGATQIVLGKPRVPVNVSPCPITCLNFCRSDVGGENPPVRCYPVSEWIQ